MATSPDASQRRDIFISHASEDKDAIARPLADELIRRGLSVWFDEYELVLGDSLRVEIDDGLAESTIGVVILSHHFFGKPWPKRELDGLHARLTGGEKNVIVPVWHELTERDLREYSPMLAGLLAGKSADGVQSLADAIERVLTRCRPPDRPGPTRRVSPDQQGLISHVSPDQRRTRRRRRAQFAESMAAAQPGPDKTVTITTPVPDAVREEHAKALAGRATASLAEHGGECLVTIIGGGRLIMELSRRGDGVITLRSSLLSPQQRVLTPAAEVLLLELTVSALSQLPARDLDKVEIRSAPTEASSALPPRLLASVQQAKMTDAIAAALRQGSDSRAISFRGDRGSMHLTKTVDTVNMSISSPHEPLQVSSIALGDTELVEQFLAGLTDISSREAFGDGRVEDSFPLSDTPSYSKLRVLTEQLIATGGRFALWQEHPVERAVLAAHISRDGALVLECPGNVPSVQRFELARMAAFVETLWNAVARLVDSYDDLLEVRASWLITEPLA